MTPRPMMKTSAESGMRPRNASGRLGVIGKKRGEEGRIMAADTFLSQKKYRWCRTAASCPAW